MKTCVLLFSCLAVSFDFIPTSAGSKVIPNSEEHAPLWRVKRGHKGELSEVRTRAEKEAIEGVIDKWDSWSALGRTARTIHTYRKDGVEARIDLQGLEEFGGNIFERFNVQIHDNSFAAIHLQRNHNYGVGLIRRAFEESRDHSCHIFLADSHNRHLRFPDDGHHYEHERITRKWSGHKHHIHIWAPKDALHHMKDKFHQD